MDFDKNDLHIVNDNDLYKTDELNKIQKGYEQFSSKEERFSSEELNKTPSELNVSPKKEEKGLKSDKSRSLKESFANFAKSMGATLSISTLAVASLATIIVVGATSGLIHVTPSNNISMFLLRSTELGFEINKEENKPIKVYLTNTESNYSQEVTSINQFVFSDLTPSTKYDLVAYDASVEPMKQVYSANYVTKDHDDYSASIDDASLDGEYLTFNLSYEGENIDFVTVVIMGDNNEVLYTYEGVPVYQLTVNIGNNQNVCCKISVNGQVTHFELINFNEDIVHVKNISLNKNSVTLSTGSREQLLATVLPENATNKGVNWESSNESVARVDNNGKVTAISAGSALITATTIDGGLTATCNVNVIQEDTPVNGVSLNMNNATIEVNGNVQLIATVLPLNAKNKSVIWLSMNENVASVDENGLVSGLSAGEALITVATVDGGYKDFCIIKVQ